MICTAWVWQIFFLLYVICFIYIKKVTYTLRYMLLYCRLETVWLWLVFPDKLYTPRRILFRCPTVFRIYRCKQKIYSRQHARHKSNRMKNILFVSSRNPIETRSVLFTNRLSPPTICIFKLYSISISRGIFLAIYRCSVNVF